MLIVETEYLDERADELSDSEVYWTYNALDCCVTYDVFDVLAPQLDDISRATYETSMATVAPFLEMMLEGFLVSDEKRREVSKVYQERLDQLERMWQRICVEGIGLPHDRTLRKGRPPLAVSYSSTKDLQYLFHTILSIPEKKRRKKGAEEATTTLDRETLEGFRSYYLAEPFINLILAMRDCEKALGFLRTKLDADNRIRCSFNVAGTNTGRLSSSFSDMGSGTNLQNVSGKLKDSFVADQGYSVVDIDLEQGDSRGVGAISWNWFVDSHGEDFAGKYLDACESGDLHTTVCRMAWSDLDWGMDEKLWRKVAEQPAYRDKTYRDLAKNLGHGSNYMGLPPTMAAHAKLPTSTVAEFQRNYFGAFPCIVAWQKETLRQLSENRYLITPFGRRRYFWGDPASSTTKNAAIAYSPQSTTGEFINRGALRLWHYRNKHNLPIRFLLQVHDSLVLLVRTSMLSELIPVILQQLKVILPLAKGREFSIPHGCKVGWNYGAYDANKNPHGLMKWSGEEKRQAPKRITSLHVALNTPIANLR